MLRGKFCNWVGIFTFIFVLGVPLSKICASDGQSEELFPESFDTYWDVTNGKEPSLERLREFKKFSISFRDGLPRRIKKIQLDRQRQRDEMQKLIAEYWTRESTRRFGREYAESIKDYGITEIKTLAEVEKLRVRGNPVFSLIDSIEVLLAQNPSDLQRDLLQRSLPILKESVQNLVEIERLLTVLEFYTPVFQINLTHFLRFDSSCIQPSAVELIVGLKSPEASGYEFVAHPIADRKAIEALTGMNGQTQLTIKCLFKRGKPYETKTHALKDRALIDLKKHTATVHYVHQYLNTGDTINSYFRQIFKRTRFTYTDGLEQVIRRFPEFAGE